VSEPIRLVLADDHTLFREGLKRILAQEPDLLVTAEASRGEEVEPAVAKGRGEVLLLDLRMPGGQAIQTLLQVKEGHPDTRTMILTAHEDADSIVDTAKAGARGYVLKDVAPATLFQAVRTIHGGGVWIDKKLPRAGDFAAIAAQSNAEPAGEEQDGIQSLTRRELEVLKLVAEGLSNEEIAARTFISGRTVKAHITNIFAKLKVNNRVKAALAIIRRGAPSPAPAASPAPRLPAGSARGR
jgi:DNA-binding NarL/FixJ family response regulator